MQEEDLIDHDALVDDSLPSRGFYTFTRARVSYTFLEDSLEVACHHFFEYLQEHHHALRVAEEPVHYVLKHYEWSYRPPDDPDAPRPFRYLRHYYAHRRV